MPSLKEVLEEIVREAQAHPQIPQGAPTALDVVRRRHLARILNFNGRRNVIAYYSGWLQRPDFLGIDINDKDISGFMANIHKLDRSKGLDLILHTPGGDLAATESIVSYLKKMFDNNIKQEKKYMVIMTMLFYSSPLIVSL